ncbi:ABC transporter ATP-binding protein [Polaribacter sp. WD7]|uniref:ABC transporter ATP-binding protein n=1 Tax=Polaribacter sp. WD7 TaxID=2269061 RepID=UPI000DF35CEF|nr:ABC transporter ATP-binding protein [Polaribacter sp. WD7]RCS27070.1 ABC transporter ATP-binding protein [Polaribacter sp. WD7]
MKGDIILKVENLSKQYRLGTVGTGTISHDINRFFAKIRGKEDPYLKIGDSNDRSSKGTSQYVWALNDINFEVKKGEVLGIIGKNGAGKSTLLKILSKVTSPSTGSIKSRGRIASLLEVGTGFHPEMTGKENIFLNGAILGMTKKEIESKFEEIVSFSGCQRYIDTPVKRYSSGMKVRLAFAVAAHLEPDILVVDEVLAVGDAEFQKKAIGKMQDISSGEGRTVLFVSHDMAAIRSLCNRVIILSDGRVQTEGKTDFIISEYIKQSFSLTKNVFENSKFIANVQIYVDENRKEAVSTLFIGGKFIIEIEFKKNLPMKIDYCFVGIEDEEEKRVLSLGTHLDHNFSGVFSEGSKVTCIVDSMPLVQGRYKGLIAIGTDNPRENKEVIKDALLFDVINDDFFENGLNLTKSQGYIALKSKWEIL